MPRPIIEYIEAEELAKLVAKQPETITIIDVRESDHVFGKVRGSLHYPFYMIENSLNQIADIAKDKEFIVFHCHYSQTRGPTAARLFEKFTRDNMPNFRPAIRILRGGFKHYQFLFKDEPFVYEKL